MGFFIVLIGGILLALKVSDFLRDSQGSEKAVEATTNKVAGFLDKLFMDK